MPGSVSTSDSYSKPIRRMVLNSKQSYHHHSSAQKEKKIPDPLMIRQRKAAPEASAGGMNMFFAPGADKFKVGPTTVLVLSFAFMGIVVALHILSKIRAVVAPAKADE